MSERAVLVTCTDGVAEVLLNRPHKRNAVNDEVYTELLHAAARLRDDRTVRAIVLAGAGAAFCAGADTSTFDLMREHGRAAQWRPSDADETAAEIIDVDGLQLGRGQRTALVWRTMPVPVIAVTAAAPRTRRSGGSSASASWTSARAASAGSPG